MSHVQLLKDREQDHVRQVRDNARQAQDDERQPQDDTAQTQEDARQALLNIAFPDDHNDLARSMTSFLAAYARETKPHRLK